MTRFPFALLLFLGLLAGCEQEAPPSQKPPASPPPVTQAEKPAPAAPAKEAPAAKPASEAPKVASETPKPTAKPEQKPAAKPKADAKPVAKAAQPATSPAGNARKPEKTELPKAKLDLRLPKHLVDKLEPEIVEERKAEEPLLPPMFTEKAPTEGPFQLNGKLLTNEKEDDYWRSVEGAELQFEFKQ
ncbi:hypothetical protein [Pseudomonas sp. PDM13]|uniref:hypothetical protein n=1 Tax=Pseudomonas sp. PDM13 TaxID=2769255 RepID=UPI0021E022E4|nr:hypothetical protein [Pseudomonas sp. PDM13]MCU9950199.1 hypothetical protein [Pseudomonas sp. PDM13]